MMTDRYAVINPETLMAMRRAGHVAKLEDRIKKLEAALRSIADIEHEYLPKPVSAAEGTLWAILDGCVVVAKRALEGKNE